MHTISAKLLIIADDPGVRAGIAACLEDAGFCVVEGTRGPVVVHACSQIRPDLVICDLGRDITAGRQLVASLLEAMPGLPLIAVSATAPATDALAVLRLGAADYLIHPLDDPALLEHSVRRALERARLQEENRVYREQLEATNQQLQASLHLLQEDQKAGRQVQLNMLPTTPWMAGDYSLAHQIIPSLYLSGDFVDYFRIDERRIGFYLADVSGHGASSAFATILLKYMTTRLLYSGRKNGQVPEFMPSEVLSHINRGLINSRIGKHVTMLGGVIDEQAGTLTYSIGGHLPLPVLFSNGEAQYLQGRGMVVGLLEQAVFRDQQLALPEAFSLSLFSDGILDLLPGATLREKELVLPQRVVQAGGTLEGLRHIFGLANLADMPDDIALLILSRNRA